MEVAEVGADIHSSDNVFSEKEGREWRVKGFPFPL
jgi:hypothetical protein